MDEHVASPTCTDDLVEHLPAPVVVHRSGGLIVYANAAMATLVGAAGPDALRGRHLTELVHPDDLVESLPLMAELATTDRRASLRLVAPPDEAPIHVDIRQTTIVFAGEPAALSVIVDVGRPVATIGIEDAIRTSEARHRALVEHLSDTGSNRLDDPAVGGLVFVLRDATTRVEHENQLRHLALHDPLTDLPNRTLATDRLRGALAAGRRQATKTALLVIDLDGFKEVNDVHGHGAGDAVLVELAARMTEGRRAVDTIGRLGGDEFAIVLPAISSAADVSTAAHRLVDLLRQPVEHRGATIQVGASVGIALAPAHGDDVDALFRAADAAMYRAKGSRLGVAVHGATG